MLVPKKSKYRKAHRSRGGLSGVAQNGSKVSFGRFGMKAASRGEVTSRQIESARRTITRFLKRAGKLWIRIFPHRPITKKAAEVPMGSGKGSVEFYVFPTLPGKIIFEIDGVSEEMAKKAFKLAGYKLSIQTKFIVRDF